jgi:hypothetical protein
MKVAKTILMVAVLAICLTILCFGVFSEKPAIDEMDPTINTEHITEPTTIPTQPEETEPLTEPILETIPIDNNKKYVGVYIEDPKEALVFEDSLNTLAWFDTFDDISATKISMCLDDHKYVAFITLEPMNMSLDEIIDGVHDEKIIAYLSLLSAGDRIHTELFVRFAHEMEMRPGYKSWYNWQGYDSETYVKVWQHVVSIGREYAPNIKWVWSPNRADKHTEAYYPGDEYVDYVGLTLNDTTISYKDFEDFYVRQGQLEALEAYNKPIIFGEVAKHDSNENRKCEYLVSILEYIKNYDKAVGVIFLNKDIRSGRQYQFSDNDMQLNAFVEKARELVEYEKQN